MRRRASVISDAIGKAPPTDEQLIEHPFEDPYVNQFIGCSNALSAGIVGLPNSGKTSLFNLLTGKAAMTDTNLFCTVGKKYYYACPVVVSWVWLASVPVPAP
jgi:hypothetical protein